MQQYEEGLRKAYEAESGLFADGDALYVAGTRGLRDVSQWPLIPTFKTRNSDIYIKGWMSILHKTLILKT